MMREVCEVTFRGRTFRIASPTYKEAKRFVENGNEMLKAQSQPTTEAWFARRDNLVIDMLNAANENLMGAERENCFTWNIDELAEQLSIPAIQYLYEEILAFSGLKPGEAQAVSVLPKSEAA